MTTLSIKCDSAIKQPRSAAIFLFTTIADTTWRVFLPTISATLIGAWLDYKLNTTLVWTVIMIIAGFAVSALLIYLQIKNVRTTE